MNKERGDGRGRRKRMETFLRRRGKGEKLE
jgi:hypothetical protein